MLIYSIAIIGFFVSAGEHHAGPSSQKYFVYLFVLGIVVHVLTRGATSGARRVVRDQESARRPKWPFRYASRLTDGLQGPRVTSFVGGIRMQPRLGPQGFSASVPFVRLSIFSNGVRLGPSSSLLSMSIPTWEGRFDELDVIQAIGRVKGVTTGILFRKSQSHEWVIFWTTNREEVFSAFEPMGITVSRELVRLRFGNQWRVNQFVEDELRPSVPSVLGTSSAATLASQSASGTSSPLTFAAPISSNVSDRTTTAPEDRKWPGVVVALGITLFVVSIFALVNNLITVPGAKISGGVATTVSIPEPVVTQSPTQWRSAIENTIRYLTAPEAGIPSSIFHLRDNSSVTEVSFDLVGLTGELDNMSSNCTGFRDDANDAPSSTLAKDAANVSAACAALVSVDSVDLRSSDNKWTPELASNDAHWLTIMKERVAVLRADE